MKIKKILVGVFACVTVFGTLPYSNYIASENSILTASAEDYTEGTYENLTYRKYSNHIEISDCKESATEVVIPGEIDGLPVTSIGNYAFNGCTGLTSITISDSVTSIGGSAFSGCTGLTSINIPDSVTSIREYAFQYCSNLTSITVEKNNSNYTDIDGILFNKDLSEIIFYPPKKGISYTIPDSVTSIGFQAFSGCADLKSIIIPDSVTAIGNYAFNGCTGLTSINIPENVTSIGSNAFYGCTGLTSINIPESVTSIGIGAFYICTGLTSVTIPDGVKSIESAAFYGCSNLTSVTIPDSITIIETYAFYKCSDLTSVTIPESVTSIDFFAFYGCKSMTSITIKNPECEINDNSNTISDTATIYGYKDSTAQAYAEKYNRKFMELGDKPANTIKGDVTGDGIVEIADIVLIASYVGDSKNNPLSSDAIIAGDVHNNGDGLTANDVLMLQQYLAGIITEL